MSKSQLGQHQLSCAAAKFGAASHHTSGSICPSSSIVQSPDLSNNHTKTSNAINSFTSHNNSNTAAAHAGGQPEGKVLIALYDYNPIGDEDLAIRKGEHLEAISLEGNGHWWSARSKSTKKIGYVPSNYVAELKSLGAEPWYFSGIGRLEAERLLKSAGNADGSFIIRDAQNDQNKYSLSLRHGDAIKHYRIRQFDEGGYYLTKKTIFSTLHDFVSHYSAHADGLCLELRAPCATVSKPTTHGLSYDSWEIDRSELELLRELGSGQFGHVFAGLWKGKTAVAVKTLKRGSMDPQEFIAEAQIMANLSHPKLVKLYAVCTREEPIYIVTELMKNGCLQNYLRANQHVELRTLISIACQIADGMAYLESHNYLHRDLAARNILVGDDNLVKIADFGLARLIKETEYEARPLFKCPIKWTSPESITHNRYTSKSDVWSFGIVLYEIITYGNNPYPNMSNKEMVAAVERNYRMPIECMPNCPTKLYGIMLKCWQKEPSRRPTFASLQVELDNFFLDSQ